MQSKRVKMRRCIGRRSGCSLATHRRIALDWQDEELLHWVAGDGAPTAVIWSGAALARSHCRAAWETWWKQGGCQIDFGRLARDPRRPGLLWICEEGAERERIPGRVW